MLAVRIDDPLIESIDVIAKKKHTNRSQIVREAIIRYLEDFEDLQLAQAIDKKISKTYTLAEVRKELGLDSQNK